MVNFSAYLAQQWPLIGLGSEAWKVKHLPVQHAAAHIQRPYHGVDRRDITLTKTVRVVVCGACSQ